MATDEQIIAAIQTKVAALSGIKAAPNNPPEAINQFPFGLCYPARFTAGGGPAPNMTKTFVTFVVEIHCARLLLPTAIAQASPYGRLLRRALWDDPRIGNTVDTLREVRGTFGFLNWAGKSEAHIGWRIEIDVKVEETTS